MEALLRKTTGRIRILTMNRPESRNALTTDLTLRLTAELRAAERDQRVAVVILTGADPAFCSGIDLAELTSGNLDPTLLVDPKRSPWQVMSSMHTPVIGAVNGPAVTAGLILALHCSFLVASERASFGDTFAKVHIHPFGGLSSLLPQAIGVRRAREISFTGGHMRAGEAYERGFVNHVVPHEDLLEFSRSLAADIADNDLEVVHLLDDLYQRTSAATVADGLALEERGYRERGMDLKRVLQRYREKIWSEPLKTSRQ